jgi:hypothetical protein
LVLVADRNSYSCVGVTLGFFSTQADQAHVVALVVAVYELMHVIQNVLTEFADAEHW